jgi:hypothetical protein
MRFFLDEERDVLLRNPEPVLRGNPEVRLGPEERLGLGSGGAEIHDPAFGHPASGEVTQLEGFDDRRAAEDADVARSSRPDRVPGALQRAVMLDGVASAETGTEATMEACLRKGLTLGQMK